MDTPARPSPEHSASLAARYARVRARSEWLARDLTPEDMAAQSMPDASPAKWHLAHTTWFFERFVLALDRSHEPLVPWADLYNSYYDAVGPQFPRAQRGVLTRPRVDAIRAWRAAVDARIGELLRGDVGADAAARVELGLHHEQQHQELLLTDVKHLFAQNPLRPAYGAPPPRVATRAVPLRWTAVGETVAQIGAGDDGFAYDNERPRHRALLVAHRLANRCVTNAEYLDFMRDGGYRRPALWMSDGWAAVQRLGWERPLYWGDDDASVFTLAGTVALDPHAPVCHVGWFEADAFARWAGARLPTEQEWESAAAAHAVDGNLQDAGVLHPMPAGGADAMQQLFGDVWEWTASPYVAYPGYRPPAGALGEYNGKFMSGQWVLRGGSCATPADHVRATYRNFFHAEDRWQFSGIRLAMDA